MPWGYALEGDVELRRQRYDAAAQALRKAVTRRQPGESLYRLHAALFLGGRKAEAAQLEADHRQRHPGDVALDMHLGDLAVASRDLASAERHYHRVLERNPSSVITLNNLAHVQLGLKRSGAVATAEKALALAPGTPAFMDALTRSLAAEQQLPRAIAWQAQAVSAASQVHQYWLQLARLHLLAGDTARARGELEQLTAVGTAFAGHNEVADLLRGINR